LLPRPAAALSTDELLSLVAMPLAVAAVAEITDVPANELSDLVATLNQANVPPTEFIQVIRYVPVALVEPGFVDYVHTQADRGVRGSALVNVIEKRLDVEEPPAPVVTVDRDYIPPIVHTRVAKLKQHPHGGPPGQLKKQAKFQTGGKGHGRGHGKHKR
ncbi:MAG TPA: hypothetical protein VN181_08805, partial [Thermoanaerobaculia bacterium]|nr:hypothetical protein [Thermoanaerobaculia bacterium]